MVDKGESVEESAKRELFEETGFVADKILHKNDGNWTYSCDPWKN